MPFRQVTGSQTANVAGLDGSDMPLPIGAADGDQITVTNVAGAAQTINALLNPRTNDRHALAPAASATFTWSAADEAWSAA